uniref:Extracellular metalloproteinase n=1 Tax=Psilocybe cubensis TaxID=181762 RepID=A0A8H7XPU0_PSICU
MNFFSLLSFVTVSLLSLTKASISYGDAPIPQDIRKSFHPKVHYEVYGEGVEAPVSGRRRSVDSTAISFVQAKLGLHAHEVVYHSGYSSDIVDHAYVKQAHNNITFSNAVGNVALKKGKVVAFGSSFVPVDKIASSTPSISLASAITSAEKSLDGTHNGHPPYLEYFVQPDGSIALTHVIQIKNADKGTWYQAHIDAHSGKLVSASNFVSHLFMEALFITIQSITEGPGQLQLYTLADLDASPLGWHSTGGPLTNTTSGNNVIASSYVTKLPIHQTSAPTNFVYFYNTTVDPLNGTNPQAGAVNAFYVMNSVHDFAYMYGFDEKAFNFQVNNFGLGGVGGDPVLLTVQDTRNFNTAQFATPPEGQSPECSTYLFTGPGNAVRRDTDMDNSMLVHEATHGITNRLTGGGTADCLGSLYSSGLGEGWSDMMADWVSQSPDPVQDFTFSRYLFNDTHGGRKYPYSTDPAVNPLRFSSLTGVTDVHSIGEVWANMLHNVYAVLVNSFGFSNEARVNPDVNKGNVIFLHLFMDALSIQPCEPSFLQARDAFIQADHNRYNGTHACMIWKAFASRGLGTNAVQNPAAFLDGSNVPSECE